MEQVGIRKELKLSNMFHYNNAVMKSKNDDGISIVSEYRILLTSVFHKIEYLHRYKNIESIIIYKNANRIMLDISISRQ